MKIEQLAARLGVTVAEARGVVRRVYRTSRPRVYQERHVKFLRWALLMGQEFAG